MNKTIDRVELRTAAGIVAGERITGSVIRGTSPRGAWEAYLPLNARTRYEYPAGSSDSERSAIRRVVAKLIQP